MQLSKIKALLNPILGKSNSKAWYGCVFVFLVTSPCFPSALSVGVCVSFVLLFSAFCVPCAFPSGSCTSFVVLLSSYSLSTPLLATSLDHQHFPSLTIAALLFPFSLLYLPSHLTLFLFLLLQSKTAFRVLDCPKLTICALKKPANTKGPWRIRSR